MVVNLQQFVSERVMRLGILAGYIGLHFITKSFLARRMTTIATISIAIQTCFVCVLLYFLSHELFASLIFAVCM